jgi:hypothetical protein
MFLMILWSIVFIRMITVSPWWMDVPDKIDDDFVDGIWE